VILSATFIEVKGIFSLLVFLYKISALHLKSCIMFQWSKNIKEATILDILPCEDEM